MRAQQNQDVGKQKSYKKLKCGKKQRFSKFLKRKATTLGICYRPFYKGVARQCKRGDCSAFQQQPQRKKSAHPITAQHRFYYFEPCGPALKSGCCVDMRCRSLARAFSTPPLSEGRVAYVKVLRFGLGLCLGISYQINFGSAKTVEWFGG
eukprot:sb/3473556/